jgi:hypothetical protein
MSWTCCRFALVALTTSVVATATTQMLAETPVHADTGSVAYTCPTSYGTFTLPVDTLGSIPSGLVSGQSFSLSNYQVQVTVPTVVVAALEENNVNSISGLTTIGVNATGATPTSQQLAVDWGPVSLPDPPAPVPINLPNEPTSLGPFTASSTSVTLTAQDLDSIITLNNTPVNCSAPSPAPVVAESSSTDPIATSFPVQKCDKKHPYTSSGNPLILGSEMAPGVPNSDVYSNFVGGTCAVTPCDSTEQPGCAEGTFGLQYQCTEFAVRWAYEYGQVGPAADAALGSWQNAHWNGAAYDMIPAAQQMSGMTVIANGTAGGTGPQPGDLIVWNATTTDGAGHVALVVKVTSPTKTGRASLSFVGENQGLDTEVTVTYNARTNVVSNDGFLGGTPLQPNLSSDAKYYVEGWIQFDNGV